MYNEAASIAYSLQAFRYEIVAQEKLKYWLKEKKQRSLPKAESGKELSSVSLFNGSLLEKKYVPTPSVKE